MGTWEESDSLARIAHAVRFATDVFAGCSIGVIRRCEEIGAESCDGEIYWACMEETVVSAG